MARSITSYVAQVTSLVSQIKSNETMLGDLQKQLEPISRNRLLAVDGELTQLLRLQQLLERANQGLASLSKEKSRAETEALLAAIDEALSDVEWDLTDLLKDKLAAKVKQQNEIIQRFQTRFSGWPDLMKQLADALEQAVQVKAPIRLEQEEYKELADLVTKANRASNEADYETFQKLLDQLDGNLDKANSNLEEIKRKAKESALILRQADLLLLRAELDSRNLYRYTVLLRTPSAPGTHGINIQERAALVSLDREEMVGMIRKITSEVNRGMVRDPGLRLANPGATEEKTATSNSEKQEENNPAPPPPADATTAADTTRKIERKFPEPTPPSSPPQSLNSLVRDVGDFMCRVVMSHQLQNYIYESPCSITITTNDLMLPWELMSYRELNEPDKDKFLCLERPVARMPMGRYFPRRHQTKQQDDTIRFLLIHSDPLNNLPGSLREVEKIYSKLREDWNEKVEIVKISGAEVTGRKLNEVLRQGNFKVIHFAGHAFFDEKEGELSSLILHQQEHLLAQKIHRLLEGRPLVFLNACQSGYAANEPDPQPDGEYLQGKAEGLASAFIYGGALGCVGSLWPIFDDPAADFAIHFYNNVLRGYMIGEAVRLARRKIKEDYNDQITWAAYVLYGDPTFRL